MPDLCGLEPANKQTQSTGLADNEFYINKTSLIFTFSFISEFSDNVLIFRITSVKLKVSKERGMFSVFLFFTCGFQKCFQASFIHTKSILLHLLRNYESKKYCMILV